MRDASAVGKALKHGCDQAQPLPFYMEHDLHFSLTEKLLLSPMPHPTTNQSRSAANSVWFCPHPALPLCSAPAPGRACPFTKGYTGHHTAIWSHRGGLGAALRWLGGTRSASSAGRLPASHSRGPDTHTLCSARRTSTN